MLAVLAVSGFVFYKHVKANGLTTELHRLGFRQSGGSAADDELLSASTQLEADHSAYFTFRRTNLSRFKDMRLAYATDSAYCVEDVKAGKWYHLTGPGGYPIEGPC